MRDFDVVVAGSSETAVRVRALVEARHGDLAGREGFRLQLAERLGGEHGGVLVVAGSKSASAVDVDGAIQSGHAVATADLTVLTGPSPAFEVWRSDRRLRVGAALLPGLPLATVLEAVVAEPGRVAHVVIEGAPVSLLRDEALVVARLMGQQWCAGHVRLPDAVEAALPLRAVIGDGFPRVEPSHDAIEAGQRVVTVTHDELCPSGLVLRGPTASPASVAEALYLDVLAFAREVDAPWREHRRRAWFTR